MLIRAIKEITYSDDSEEYLQNYLSSLKYVQNAYFLLQDISKFVPQNKISFLPTFTQYSSNMNYFVIKSGLFLGDSKQIKRILENEKLNSKYIITRDGNTLSLIIKEK